MNEFCGIVNDVVDDDVEVQSKAKLNCCNEVRNLTTRHYKKYKSFEKKQNILFLHTRHSKYVNRY